MKDIEKGKVQMEGTREDRWITFDGTKVLVNLLGALWLLSERDETFPEANY